MNGNTFKLILLIPLFGLWWEGYVGFFLFLVILAGYGMMCAITDWWMRLTSLLFGIPWLVIIPFWFVWLRVPIHATFWDMTLTVFISTFILSVVTGIGTVAVYGFDKSPPQYQQPYYPPPPVSLPRTPQPRGPYGPVRR